jgi:two-component system, NarL family, sensor histidine kinase DegS
MAQELKAAQDTLRSYIGAITDSTEKERTRLARELHDETLQAQIALGQRVQYELLDPGNGSDQAVLKELQQMIQHNIRDLRQLVRGMRPLYLEDLGLAAAVEALCKERQAGLQTVLSFWTESTEKRLPEEVELAFYRIAQEGISNALRHAQAEKIQVSLFYGNDRVAMTISDNGKGFEVPANLLDAVHHGHFGLLDIKERAEIAGAHIEIKSSPGKGTSITVTYSEKTNNNEGAT